MKVNSTKISKLESTLYHCELIKTSLVCLQTTEYTTLMTCDEIIITHICLF